MFDAGALVFKLQTVGAQIFKQDQADAKAAVEKTGQAAQDAKPKIDELGKSTDETGKKAKSAKAPLDEQAKATEEVGEQSRKAKPKQDEQKKSTEQQAEAAKKLSVVLLAAGTAVAAMVALAVVKQTEFGEAMSNVRAATMATAAEQKKLGDAALQAGGDTKYSATEAANAEEELAKAGLTVSEIVGGSLNGALALAAAGQLQVARSAEIMATTLKQYHLEASQSGHVADLLAAGAGKAQGSVDDLALALQYVGPVAAGLGISVEETTGALALFASQGQIGERAGTGLRGVLMSLTSPSALAAKTMKEYGIEIFDSNGKMKSLADVSQELKGAFGGLTEAERSAALGRIFGNEQITAARVLYEGGAKAVKDWTAEVNDSGYAAQQAAMRQDNLAGDVEKLGGAFDTALIKSGSAGNDVLRLMVQSVTALVDGFADAPDAVQGTALVLGVATAAILLFGGGAVMARVKFAELKAQLDATNMSMGKTALMGGAVGLALTGIITVVALLAQAQAEARAKAEAYADTLEEGTLRVTKATRDMVKEALATKGSFLWMQNDSAFDAAKKLGLSLDTVTEAAMGNVKAMREVEAATKETNSSRIAASSDHAKAAKTVRDAVAGEKGSIEEAIRVAEQKADADKGVAASSQAVADGSKSATDAYLDESKSVDDLTQKLDSLLDTINDANKANQDAISSNIDYQDALAKVNDQIAKIQEGQDGYSATLDVTTQAGRDNMSMLQSLAKNAWDASVAQLQLDGDTAGFNARLADARQRLYDAAKAMGAGDDAAAALRDSILRVPTEHETQMIVQTANAQRVIDQFVNSNNGKTVTIYTSVQGQYAQTAGTLGKSLANATGNIVEMMADGGLRGRALTPMAGLAQMVPPNTYRVVGDRLDVPELFAPLDGSARSWALLMEGFARMPGSPPQAMANGGVTATSSLQGMSITGTLEIGGDGLARIIDGKITAYDTAVSRGVGRRRR